MKRNNHDDISHSALGSRLEKIASEFSHLEDLCFYAHLNSENGQRNTNPSHTPVKVEGIVLVGLVRGTVNIVYNIEEYQVEGPAIMTFSPGTLASITSDNWDDIDAYILYYSPEFLQEINISYSTISGQALLDRKEPYLKISDKETSLMTRYVKLLHEAMKDSFNLAMTKHIVSSLSSAMFYQVMSFFYRSIQTFPSDSVPGQRRNTYVHEFLKLVHVYYTKERSISFYASKLFISPKYLSVLVKEATGISAARWIDRFVITEAKNLLRYSGKNIQQVAYALNFSNQSSFGKYFKHLTGMSPTEYQKS